MSTRLLRLLIVLFVSVGALVAAAAAAENPTVWSPQTRSVSVFKNGLGFFVREGSTRLREGWCVADAAPPATFGAFGVYAMDEGQQVDIVGTGPGERVEFDGVDAPGDAASIRTRLEASIDLRVRLEYTVQGQDRSAEGDLTAVGEEFAVVDDGEHSFAVPLASVKAMQLLDKPVRIHVQGGDNSEAAPAQSTLRMAYLRKGITWVPEYTLRILDDATAELTLRGTVINEAEDLLHCDIQFVVGAPNFAHSDALSALVSGQNLRAMGRGLGQMPPQSQIAISNLSNSFTAEGSGGSPVLDGPIDTVLSSLPRIEGPASADYTVYTKEDMTLRKGERAMVTLFVARVSYEHLYRWSPPGRIEHFLRLDNATDTAWTTGPCLATSEGNPLSEDLLRYTPRGADVDLPVTTAINLRHSKDELEQEREFKALTISGDRHLDRVTLAGTLSLHNFEDEAVTVEIDFDVPGKPLDASDEGKLQAGTDRLSLTELAGSIHWEVMVPPGEEKQVSYTYERFVRTDAPDGR